MSKDVNFYEEVKRFQEAFDHPVGKEPKMLTEDRVEDRGRWMLEELNEFIESDNLVDQLDGITDLLYLVMGTFVEMGIDPLHSFKIVQKANMNKLGEDGKPVFKPDGKIGKPEGWQPPEPELKALIEELKKKSA